ncbi:hypothetical protein VP01_989g2 [Puccinia sorghi]|uniref:Uncharacterized protein n=1 Tax=Puccinia sorghi TaxID=27349 RepID=A0A0L6U5F7_9BASI|nr:hypothetical protein VP01_989g2 [Puccinia sorghi]
MCDRLLLGYNCIKYQSFTASAVSIFLYFNQHPGLKHWKEVLHLRVDNLPKWLQFYMEATWAEDQENRVYLKTKNIIMSLKESKMNVLLDASRSNFSYKGVEGKVFKLNLQFFLFLSFLRLSILTSKLLAQITSIHHLYYYYYFCGMLFSLGLIFCYLSLYSCIDISFLLSLF